MGWWRRASSDKDLVQKPQVMGSRQPPLLATGDVQMEHGKMRVSRQTGKTVRGDYCSRIEPDKDPKREKKSSSDHKFNLESVSIWRQGRKGSWTMPGMKSPCWQCFHDARRYGREQAPMAGTMVGF